MIYGIIYKVTNQVNGKIYIGQTRTDLTKRKKSHLQVANSKRIKKYLFQHAIAKYGEKEFTWEIIDQAVSRDELNEKEISWIAFFDSTGENGYNLRPGGNSNANLGKPVSQYNLSGELVATFDSATIIADKLGMLPGDIGRCCHGTVNQLGNHFYLYTNDWTAETEKIEIDRRLKAVEYRKEHSGKKIVIAFDSALKETVFASIYEASKQLGTSRRLVKYICNGEGYIAKQHTFFYKEDVPEKADSHYADFLNQVQERFNQSRKRHGIIQVDMHGRTHRFDSKKACTEDIRVTFTTLEKLLACDMGYHKDFFYFHEDGYTKLEYKRRLKKWESIYKPTVTAFHTCQLPSHLQRKNLEVLQFDRTGNLVSWYPNATIASEQLGISVKTIQSCCRGGSKRVGGFIWVYSSNFLESKELEKEIRKRIA